MKSLKRIMAKCRGFDQRGIAAVEFALVLPFMLYLYFGGFELIQGVMIHRQASNAAPRWAAATTISTLVSPISKRPNRWTIDAPRTGKRERASVARDSIRCNAIGS